jgi:hypothetical protein
VALLAVSGMPLRARWALVPLPLIPGWRLVRLALVRLARALPGLRRLPAQRVLALPARLLALSLALLRLAHFLAWCLRRRLRLIVPRRSVVRASPERPAPAILRRSRGW